MKVIDQDGQALVLSHGSIYLSSNLGLQKDEFLKRLEETDMVWVLTRKESTGRCRKVMETYAEQISITGPVSDSFNRLTSYYGVFIPS